MTQKFDAKVADEWLKATACDAAASAEAVAETHSGLGVCDMADLKTYLTGFIAGAAFATKMLENDKPENIHDTAVAILTSYLSLKDAVSK